MATTAHDGARPGDEAALVERFYGLAKRGDWSAVLAGWRSSPAFARECAHYAKATSGWGFLHQAAYAGRRAAVVALVGWGADAGAVSRGGETPSDVARRHGHAELAALLVRAAVVALVGWGADAGAVSRGGETPSDVARQNGHAEVAALLVRAAAAEAVWAPPDRPDVLPSSPLWREARPRVATARMAVGYGGGRVTIEPGDAYWVDSFERTLVGWHGTYSPPRGMDGEPMVSTGPSS
jgi:hypothetical protein